MFGISKRELKHFIRERHAFWQTHRYDYDGCAMEDPYPGCSERARAKQQAYEEMAYYLFGKEFEQRLIERE